MSAEKIDDLDKRVTVVESEQDHIKEDIKDLKSYSNETYDIVFEMKERMDKQNRNTSSYIRKGKSHF